MIVPLLGDGSQPLGSTGGTYVCPYHDGTSNKGSKHSPRSPGGPQVRPEHGLHNTPKATVNTNTYRYPHVSPDPIQVGPF